MKKIIFYLLLVLTIGKLVLFVTTNQKYFTRVFDPLYFGKLYSESQYVIGERSKGGIGDDGLYAFAGYYYLFQKGDVSAVNFEHPPLGKYLIGVSVAIFGNENIINLIYFAALLYITYKTGIIIMKNNLLALISLTILAYDSLFLDNLLRSLLDLPFTLFFTAATYFFLKSLDNPKFYFPSMFFWGAAFSTRFFPAIIFVYFLFLVIILIYKQKHLRTFFLSSVIIPAVYLIVHISFFIYHPSLLEFLKHKKWMLSWFTGSPHIFGNIWRNIYTGTYIDTKGKVYINEHWLILVPVITALAISSLRKSFFVKKHRNILIIYSLTVVYLIYVTVITDGLQKFIMPVYPLMAILAVVNLASFYSIIMACRRRILPR